MMVALASDLHIACERARHYRMVRGRQRARRRADVLRRVRVAIDPKAHGQDPLVRPQGRTRQVLVVLALCVGSVSVHGAVLMGSVLVGQFLAASDTRGRGGGEVTIAVVHIPAPVPTEPPPSRPLPRESDGPLATPPVPTVIQPRPRRVPRRAPRRVAPRRVAPPPDPIDRPRQPVAPRADPKPPRRIVGLSLESTVSGGTGPALAVGNTRMGSTSRVAADPHRVRRLKKTEQSNPRPAVITLPKRLSSPKPTYPSELKRLGVEGQVTMAVTVATNGRVKQVVVVRSSKHAAFNRAAADAAKRGVYRAARKDGVAFEMTITFTVRFRLN